MHRVATAVEHGLIEGFSNGTFRPNEEITREQMSVFAPCTEACRYGSGDRKYGHHFEGFKDREHIASWSEEAVSAIVKSG